MTIKFSPRLGLLLLFMHATAALVVSVTEVPLIFKVATILMVAFSLVYYLARDVLMFLPVSWHEILLEQKGVKVVARDKSSFRAKVANSTIVNPYCIVFRVGLDVRHLLVSRVIFPDSMSPGEFRELCIGLKFA